MIELLKETEMVANKYSNGGIIIIRTNSGWKAFIGNLKPDYQHKLERGLYKQMPDYSWLPGSDLPREPTLREALQDLLTRCGMNFDDYFPMSLSDDFEDDDVLPSDF